MEIGLLGLLGVAFVVLKLTEVIAWSWIWVLSPFIVGFVLKLLLWAFILLWASLD